MKILGISGFPRLQEKKDLSMKEKNEKLLSPKNMRDLPSSNVDVCGWWWVNNKTKKTQMGVLGLNGRGTGRDSWKGFPGVVAGRNEEVGFPSPREQKAVSREKAEKTEKQKER